MAPPTDSQATLSLVLGILSAICCPIVGPVAFFMGNASRQRIQASGGTISGGGLATAGMILGIIGTVWILLIILGVVTGVASALRPS
jgi:hypothetical protein